MSNRGGSEWPAQSTEYPVVFVSRLGDRKSAGAASFYFDFAVDWWDVFFDSRGLRASFRKWSRRDFASNLRSFVDDSRYTRSMAAPPTNACAN